jgi:hypothetical protein
MKWHCLDLRDLVAYLAAGVRAGRACRPTTLASRRIGNFTTNARVSRDITGRQRNLKPELLGLATIGGGRSGPVRCFGRQRFGGARADFDRAADCVAYQTRVGGDLGHSCYRGLRCCSSGIAARRATVVAELRGHCIAVAAELRGHHIAVAAELKSHRV